MNVANEMRPKIFLAAECARRQRSAVAVSSAGSFQQVT
jgi:hypothetical protein